MSNPKIRGATVQHTYKYKGKTILEKSAWNSRLKKYYKEFYMVEDRSPSGYYSTLMSAKKAIDAWEKKQYKKDRRKI